MYKGVLRDDERRKEKMLQRQAELEESRRKREIYERVQTVMDRSAFKYSGPIPTKDIELSHI
jgi:protein PET117